MRGIDWDVDDVCFAADGNISTSGSVISTLGGCADPAAGGVADRATGGVDSAADDTNSTTGGGNSTTSCSGLGENRIDSMTDNVDSITL